MIKDQLINTEKVSSKRYWRNVTVFVLIELDK